jgi:hypothetical protein
MLSPHRTALGSVDCRLHRSQHVVRKRQVCVSRVRVTKATHQVGDVLILWRQRLSQRIEIDRLAGWVVSQRSRAEAALPIGGINRHRTDE